MGNPGSRYAETRHNIGFLAVDRLAANLGITLRKPLFKAYEICVATNINGIAALIKPLSFMNNSGASLPRILGKLSCTPEQVLVICDTLDLPSGVCRLKRRGKDAGHNGLKSIMSSLGTGDFARLYIGIGRPDTAVEVVDWVLGVPGTQERALLEEAIIRSAKAVELLLDHSLEYVMNELNKKPDKTN